MKSSIVLSPRTLLLAAFTAAATLTGITAASAHDEGRWDRGKSYGNSRYDDDDRGKHNGWSRHDREDRGEWRERQQRQRAWQQEQERQRRREAWLEEQRERERREHRHDRRRGIWDWK